METLTNLQHLQQMFPKAGAISRLEFRRFFRISTSTDARMKREGLYPKTTYACGSERILLTHLAAWLDAGGGIAPPDRTRKPGRGRPKGSKNKPKATIRHTPTLPPHMAEAAGIVPSTGARMA